MIKIVIKWNYVSPFLHHISGDANILVMSTKPDKITYAKEYKIHIKKDEFALNFAPDINGEPITSDLFDIVRDRLVLMVNSYYNGLSLEKSMSNWLDIQDEKNFLDLLLKKEKQMDEEGSSNIKT